LADRASEVTKLDHQLTQTRVQFEHYQEATAARRAEERQAYEQRIARLEQDLASANRQTAVQQTTIGQQEMRIANFAAECDRQDQALHATQEELTAVRSARDRLTDQVRDLMTAKDDLVARLTAAQQQLSDMRAALAAQEQASSMLTDQVRRAEERADHLAQEKHTWLQDRGALEQRLLSAEQKLAALTDSATTAADEVQQRL
jgi:chromosome segregation ATPase